MKLKWPCIYLLDANQYPTVIENYVTPSLDKPFLRKIKLGGVIVGGNPVE